MLGRLIAKGKGSKKSRLHNYNGQFLDAAGFLYLPKSIFTTLSFKLANSRPVLPWLGFRAIKYIDGLMNRSWKVLEFGSGMSTIWLARRCEFLVSIETDKGWYESVRSMLTANGLKNVDYRLRDQSEAHVLRDCKDSYFDFVLVDGVHRDRAMMTAIKKVKPGGYIYLDNSDLPNREHPTAKAVLISAAGGKSNVRIFNDLSPTRVCVDEGTLAHLGNKPE